MIYLADKDAKEEIKEYHAHLLSDLINNAKRRIEEGKYDDAVARLYRVIEFIAQSKLFIKHDINTSDVDILLLPNELREKYKKMEENGKIRLGLKKSYELLRDMNEEIGKRFFENEEIQKILSMRNNSILAHGFGPVTKEQAEKFFEVTKEFLTTEIKETEQFKLLMVEQIDPNTGLKRQFTTRLTEEIKQQLEEGELSLLRERTSSEEVIKWVKISGSEVLEGPKTWIGKYIPVIPVFGDEIIVNGKRYLLSLIRNAKDAQRMYNYWSSSATETVALAPAVARVNCACGESNEARNGNRSAGQ